MPLKRLRGVPDTLRRAPLFPTLATSSPLAHYQSDSGLVLNGNTVSSWLDTSGNGNHLVQSTASRQPTYVSSMQNGWPGLRFDGADDFLAIADYGVSLSQVTIFIVYKNNITNTSLGHMAFDGGDAEFYMMNDAANRTKIYAGQTLNWAENYPHTAMQMKTVRFSNATSVCFINGVFQTIGTTGAVGDAFFTRFTLGAQGTGTAAASTPMDVCEVIIYGEALSNEDRLLIESYLNLKYQFGVSYPAPPGLATDLVAYWRFDEATGTTRNDSVGTNHLTDNGTVTQVAGKIDNAAYVNGSPQYLSVASNPVLSFGDTPFSIAGWLYPTSVAGVPVFISKFATSSKGQFDLYLSGGELAFSVYDGTSGGSFAQASVFGALTANTWYFVAGVYDRDNGLVKISVNGGDFESTIKTIIPVATSTSLKFGQEDSANFAHARYDGWGLWKRALSLKHVQALYNGGVGFDPTA